MEYLVVAVLCSVWMFLWGCSTGLKRATKDMKKILEEKRGEEE